MTGRVDAVAKLSLADYWARLGKELGVSRWIEISQERIDRFADCTGDRQYIHIDPERARTSPFGTTIAHGFLTLSMLSEMHRDLVQIEGVRAAVNYGTNRVRFLSPVRSGSRIRGRFILAQIDEIRPGEVRTTFEATVEAEGMEKPALVAEWLLCRYLDTDDDMRA